MHGGEGRWRVGICHGQRVVSWFGFQATSIDAVREWIAERKRFVRPEYTLIPLKQHELFTQQRQAVQAVRREMHVPRHIIPIGVPLLGVFAHHHHLFHNLREMADYAIDALT